MDAESPSSSDFQFRDPRQRRIYEGLQRLVGDGAALMYRDACRLMTIDPPFHATTHLVIHLFREIESSLRGLLVPYAKLVDPPEKGGRHVQEIDSVISFLQLSQDDPIADFWRRIALEKELPTRAHRDSLAPPRRATDAEFSQMVDGIELLFDLLLQKCEENYLIFYSKLNDLLQISNPTETDVERLRNDVPNNLNSFSYFFSRANDEWLEPLAKKSFFQRPPEPIDGMAYPWSESRYLLRVADTKPDKVWEIALGIPSTQNPFVREDICEIALKVRAAKTVQKLPDILNWIDESYSIRLPLIIPRISLHLAQGGETDKALELIQKLLEVHPNPNEQNIYFRDPLLRIDASVYGLIIEESIPQLIVHIGWPLLELLSTLLKDAIEFAALPKPDDEADPSRWIPVNPLNYQTGAQYLLLNAVRDGAEQLVQIDPSNLILLVEKFKAHPYVIFQRLTIHLLNAFPAMAPQLVAETLTERRYFEDKLVEYRALLSRQFAHLSPSEQAIILEWIDRGPHGLGIKEREDQHWQLFWLRHISEHLPEEWQQHYERLVDLLGKPSSVDYERGETRLWVGPTSPVTADELKLMSIEDIVTFLRTWQPQNDFMSPSLEGLGRFLADVVTLSPERFAENALLFRELDPTYIRNLIIGFGEAAKQKKRFPWQHILGLSKWVMEQPRELSREYSRHEDRDPHWGWARGEIADLLLKGFVHDQVPYDLRSMAWQVLLPATSDPDPTPDYETEWIKSGQHSPSHAALNTTRGKGMRTVFEYARWLARSPEIKEKQENTPNALFSEMPEVRELLNFHLEHDRSLTIRSIYGQYFPLLLWLDRDWTLEARNKIFSTESKDDDLYTTAWDSYLIHCHPSGEVFQLLKTQYRTAIENLRDDKEARLPGEDPDVQVVHHLMTLYWWGIVTLDTSDSLVTFLFERAPQRYREVAIRFVGVSLGSAKDAIEEPVLNRLKTLWSYRLEIGRTAISEHAIELRAFKWWFTSGKFDPEWSVPQLKQVLELVSIGDTMAARSIVERLMPVTPQLPVLVGECLELIVRSNLDGWFVRSCEESIKAILDILRNSLHTQAQELSRKIANILASRGFPNFGEIS